MFKKQLLYNTHREVLSNTHTITIIVRHIWISLMELRHLRYFITVAEELSFSKAAVKLHTAQPSLSQQIKDLEDDIGVQLFYRTKRKVELTEEGLVF